MSKGRTEAFSDGVLAVIITIMVLEMQSPHGTTPAALRPVLPVFLAYALSFIYLAIYWTNHHHLFQAAEHVDGRVLWANLHFLFWISLVPFVTAWMGENPLATWTVAVYGVDLLLTGLAYFLLVRTLVALHGPHSKLARAIGGDLKTKVSIVIYAVSLALAFVRPWLAPIGYVAVAIIWIVPDRRIERTLAREKREKEPA